MPHSRKYLALPLFAASALLAQYPKPSQAPLYGNHIAAQKALAPTPPLNNNLAAPIDNNPKPAGTASTAPFTITMDAPKEGAKSITGGLDGADVDQLAMALLAALQGGLLLAKALRDAEPLRTALNTTIDHIASFATTETP